MKKILFIPVLFSIIFSSSFGALHNFSDFNSSLSHLYLIEKTHLDLLSEETSLAAPSILQQMGLGGTAEAYYNDIFNTVVFRKEFIVGRGAAKRVKGHLDFRADGRQALFPVFASTAFHEFAHADLDIFIEEGRSDFNDFLQNELNLWFRKNFPLVNSKLAVHELFGYTAGEIILLLNSEINEVAISHGLKVVERGCFMENGLKKIFERMNLGEELIFKATNGGEEYYRAVYPSIIWLKGKELYLDSANFPDQWKMRIYDYFRAQYNLPRNREELRDRMNRSHYLKLLEKCHRPFIEG